MNEIEYVIGDATSPKMEGNKIIVHICNDIGAWGRGFVMAISKKWKQPEIQYKNWAKQLGGSLPLGAVQFVTVDEDLIVANMIGQSGIKRKVGDVPIRYDAVRKALVEVAKTALQNNSSVHMPRIGCGLAGGEWHEIEKIINETLTISNVSVTVYDLE